MGRRTFKTMSHFGSSEGLDSYCLGHSTSFLVATCQKTVEWIASVVIQTKSLSVQGYFMYFKNKQGFESAKKTHHTSRGPSNDSIASLG